jgi:hypothetical protein
MWRSTRLEFSWIPFLVMEWLNLEEGLLDARHVKDVFEANVRCF